MRKKASALVIIGVLGLVSVSCRPRPDGNAKDAGSAAGQAMASIDSGPVRIVRPGAPASFVDVVADVSPSVVGLRSRHQVSGGPASALPGVEAPRALGTGFVVDSEGYILTNHHVLGNATELTVLFEGGDEVGATIVGRDPKLDIALLKIAPTPNLVSARFGDSKTVAAGDWVAAIGRPFGGEIDVSVGVLSSTGSAQPGMISGGTAFLAGFLRTDARLGPLNAGGPVINTAGEVIAVATAAKTGDRGFAVPIHRAQQILPMLKKDGVVTRAWLGVFVRPVSSADGVRLHLESKRGALVSEVVVGGPSAKAGIAVGDVILELDGQRVDHESLPWMAAGLGIGRQVNVVVWRDGGQRTLVLHTARMPE